ncbi:outer membrane protein OmpA-like peptidoglycan-associated protein [Sphaerotilus hippei]|uniref:Outer membrane protein OmpA-like peptidoglycan-associated protein n=1 Tax=Sphaerotilus hippei TaxID=744406 RepID=A0A318GVX9_9BURK|nr:OmpA family protein [Sphaerotilus hippei]PXW93428.1 outer membrane protein OmpA-like peptidoglycan-associated protein [Sphaerotilus hippei]
MTHSIATVRSTTDGAPRPLLQTRVLTVAALCLALGLGACESMGARERGTATGAAVGAAAGAAIGSVSGANAGKGAVLGGVVGAVAGNLWSRHLEDKRKALEAQTAGTGIEVGRTADNQLKVNVPSDFSFDVGRAAIRPDMRPVLDEIGRNLDPKVRVTIVGHTDSTGSDAINDPLSLDRAEAVRDYLAGRGVSASRVTVQGQGARQPRASNATEAGRAQNRRVEILLAEPSA